MSLLANLLYFSLVHIYQNKDGQCQSKELQVSFNNYWKLACSHLSLQKLNLMLKPNRTNAQVVEPLLKTLFIMLQAKSAGQGDEAENKVSEDLLLMLRELIVKEQENMNIVKLSSVTLAKLKDVFPHTRQQSLDILKELTESLQDLIRK